MGLTFRPHPLAAALITLKLGPCMLSVTSWVGILIGWMTLIGLLQRLTQIQINICICIRILASLQKNEYICICFICSIWVFASSVICFIWSVWVFALSVICFICWTLYLVYLLRSKFICVRLCPPHTWYGFGGMGIYQDTPGIYYYYYTGMSSNTVAENVIE